MDFRGYTPFLDQPDPRRVDLRASLGAIPRQLMVRTYYERGAVPVYALVDVSSSMRFEGGARKHELAAEIAASIAWSATRNGDAFGLVACDDNVRMELFEPPSTRRSVAIDIRRRLLAVRADMVASASALPQACERLRRSRSLVFLISDFYFEASLMRDVMESLSMHDVVPIVLWDRAEYIDLPRWGWARVRDMEGGGDRSLFLRPALARRIRDAYAERQDWLASQCREYGVRPPFYVHDVFHGDLLTRHMLETC